MNRLDAESLCEVCRSLPGISEDGENLAMAATHIAMQASINSMHITYYSGNGFDKAFVSQYFLQNRFSSSTTSILCY